MRRGILLSLSLWPTSALQMQHCMKQCIKVNKRRCGSAQCPHSVCFKVPQGIPRPSGGWFLLLSFSYVLFPHQHGCGRTEVKLFLWVVLQQAKLDLLIKFNIFLFVCEHSTKQKIGSRCSPGYDI